ncbi:MAG: XRE family transcriptional regulator [Coriobacteriales bacterium]|nr:XRE family transcriptional regulator [Coriobacteriales bacterium]
MMDEPLTEKLLDELLSSPDPDCFLERYDVGTRDLSGYLQELLATHGLVRKDVVHAANLNETYGYELFIGKKRNPGRDKVLMLAFGMGLTLRETDRLLQVAGVSRLYCKDRRDAIIIFCLDRGISLQETNETLFSRGENVLE